MSKTYVGVLPKKEPIPLSKSEKWKRSKDGSFQKPDYGRFKTKEEKWLKKRTEARIIRRRMKEPMRNLKSFLLTSGKFFFFDTSILEFLKFFNTVDHVPRFRFLFYFFKLN